MATFLDKGRPATPHDILSDREMQVLRLLGQGKTVSAIADDVALSARTISTSRARPLEKHKLRTMASASYRHTQTSFRIAANRSRHFSSSQVWGWQGRYYARVEARRIRR
jgi:DNA-binding NarL/FixJ family response regulator